MESIESSGQPRLHWIPDKVLNVFITVCHKTTTAVVTLTDGDETAVSSEMSLRTRSTVCSIATSLAAVGATGLTTTLLICSDLGLSGSELEAVLEAVRACGVSEGTWLSKI